MEPKNDKLNIDNWNERLDENLESPHGGNPEADRKAEAFNEEFGSDHLRSHPKDIDNNGEDNLKINHPEPHNTPPGEIEREE
jgi:hypothetical protein